MGKHTVFSRLEGSIGNKDNNIPQTDTFNKIPHENPNRFSRNGQAVSKIYRKGERNPDTKTNGKVKQGTSSI